MPSSRRAVRAIGVDGQSWACVPVDEAGRILANTPIWMDTRAQSICDEVLAHVPAADILAVAGNRLSPSYTTAKVLWFQRNAPDVFARTRWFLQCNSVVVMALTGVASQEHSQGYGLHFIDVATGAVDVALAARLGIDPDLFPSCCGAVGDRRRSHGGRRRVRPGSPRGLPWWPVGLTLPAALSARASTGSVRPRSRAARRAGCRSPWTLRQPTNG